jgi:hypothetical protein
LTAAGSTGTAALVTGTAGATATTATTSATGTAGCAADYGLGGAAEAMAGGIAEGYKRTHNDDGDAHDEKCVFRCILTGVLAPKAF